MLHPSAPLPPEEVEAQAVSVEIYRSDQTGAHCGPAGWVNVTFEDRILHPLAVIRTDPGDAAQAF